MAGERPREVLRVLIGSLLARRALDPKDVEAPSIAGEGWMAGALGRGESFHGIRARAVQPVGLPASSVRMATRVTSPSRFHDRVARRHWTTNSPAMFCRPMACTNPSTSACGKMVLPVMWNLPTTFRIACSP